MRRLCSLPLRALFVLLQAVLPAVIQAGGDVARGYPAGRARSLIICSHGRVAWFDVDTLSYDVIHQGRGIYYGVFPGEPGTIWVVSRPHNADPNSTRGVQEMLLNLDLSTGALLAEQPIATRFTHDAIRHNDSVYVASTGKGRVLRMHYPSFKVERTLKGFTRRHHVNTLAVWPPLPRDNETRRPKRIKKVQARQAQELAEFKVADDYYDYRDGETEDVVTYPADERELWCMLHNKGQSAIVRVGGRDGKFTGRWPQAGISSHGLVLWRDRVVFLSSGEGRLMSLDVTYPKQTKVAPELLWQDPDRTFMKGLVVIADVAYFGMSEWTGRAGRGDPNKTSEVLAFDLIKAKLLWRSVVNSAGLLNIVAAPHLAEHSTYMHVEAWPQPIDSTSPFERDEL